MKATICLSLIPALPLAGTLLMYLGLKFSNRKKYLHFLGRFSILASMMFSALAFFYLIRESERAYYFYTFKSWLMFESIKIPLSLFADRLSLIPLLLIGIVTLITMVYISRNHKDEEEELRLIWYVLALYSFTALFLVGGSYIITFFSWSSIGLLIFLITSDHHYQSKSGKENNSTLRFFFIFDLLLLQGLILLFVSFKTLEYQHIFTLGSLNFSHETQPLFLLSRFMLILGIAGRLPLFPFGSWLPETLKIPKSLRLYLYTSILPLGIYFLLRISFLLKQHPAFGVLLAVLGSLSVLTGLFFILFQTDSNQWFSYTPMVVMGCVSLLLSTGQEFIAYYAWLICICFLPFTIFSTETLILSSNRKFPIIPYSNPHIYLAVKNNLWFDKFIYYLFVLPVKELSGTVWILDGYFERFYSHWMPSVFKKWSEISLLFDNWIINGEFRSGTDSSIEYVNRRRLFIDLFLLSFSIIILAILVILI